MYAKTIGIIAAMPEETAPLLRKVGPVHREQCQGLNLYRFKHGGKEVCLLESRIGMEQAARATRALLDSADIGMILNIGLGGAPFPGLSVGDIVVAGRLLFFKDRLFSEQQGLDARFAAGCISALRGERNFQVYLGTSITAAEILDKKSLAALIPSGCTVSGAGDGNHRCGKNRQRADDTSGSHQGNQRRVRRRTRLFNYGVYR